MTDDYTQLIGNHRSASLGLACDRFLRDALQDGWSLECIEDTVLTSLLVLKAEQNLRGAYGLKVAP
jgi:hypothetical protein